MGLKSVEDLLFTSAQVQDKTRLTCIGELGRNRCSSQRHNTRLRYCQRPQTTLIVKVDDGTGLVTLRFFHFRRAQALQLKVGDTITLFGQPRLVGVPPSLRILNTPLANANHNWKRALTPVYPVTEGMGQSTMRNLTQQALTYLTQNPPKTFFQTSPVTAHRLQIRSNSYTDRRPRQISRHSCRRTSAQLRLALEELVAHQISLLSHAREHTKKQPYR